jgi:glycosyltransferase involved in cell wall biosynthesis
MKRNKNKTACILPFYNEGLRVVKVIENLLKVNNLGQIICVDDGSTDKIFLQIKTKFPKVVLIRLSKNQGKTIAVKNGLRACKFPNVLLFDADLINVRPEEISQAIAGYEKRPGVDMLLLRRLNDPFIFRILRTELVLSGERILKNEDLKKILQTKPNRFQLELAINDYMIRNDKKVYWFPVSTKNTFKSEKYGVLTGIQSEYKMLKDLFSYQNPTFMLVNLAIFARERLKENAGDQAFK